MPEKVQLKDPKAFRIIGKATTRIDAKAKSSGQQDFGIDMNLPGQLTAVVAHPPVFGGKLASMDDAAARAVKGVKAVLRVPVDGGGQGVTVIADGYWQAKQGRDALKLQWDTAGVENVDSDKQLAQYRELADKPGPRLYEADMSPLASAPHKLDAEFFFPYLAHAPMEPLNCTVQVAENGAQLWVGTQMPGFDGAAAARVLGLKPEQIQVNVQTAGGGFGRRGVGTSDFVVLACEVAKAAKTAGLNAPIRTLWSREDDIKGGYYRPVHLHRARIGFDDKGKVLAWEHVLVGQSIVAGTPLESMIKNGIDATATEGMRDPYPVPMQLTVHHPKVNVPVLWWRSVGSTHTAFVMETLIDEIARATKQDPVAYRMALFGEKSPRHKAALQLAVERSGYGKTTLPRAMPGGLPCMNPSVQWWHMWSKRRCRMGNPCCIVRSPACIVIWLSTRLAWKRRCRVLPSWACRCACRALPLPSRMGRCNRAILATSACRVLPMRQRSPCTSCPVPSRRQVWASRVCRLWRLPLQMPLPALPESRCAIFLSNWGESRGAGP